MPGHPRHRIVGERVDEQYVEVGDGAECGAGEQRDPPVARGCDGGGDRRAEHDPGQGIHRAMLAAARPGASLTGTEWRHRQNARAGPSLYDARPSFHPNTRI